MLKRRKSLPFEPYYNAPKHAVKGEKKNVGFNPIVKVSKGKNRKLILSKERRIINIQE